MELFTAVFMADLFGTPAYFWMIFVGIVAALLIFDLGVLHKDNQEISAKESFILYGGYVAIALAFGAWSGQLGGRVGESSSQGFPQSLLAYWQDPNLPEAQGSFSR